MTFAGHHAHHFKEDVINSHHTHEQPGHRHWNYTKRTERRISISKKIQQYTQGVPVLQAATAVS